MSTAEVPPVPVPTPPLAKRSARSSARVAVECMLKARRPPFNTLVLWRPERLMLVDMWFDEGPYSGKTGAINISLEPDDLELLSVRKRESLRHFCGRVDGEMLIAQFPICAVTRYLPRKRRHRGPSFEEAVCGDGLLEWFPKRHIVVVDPAAVEKRLARFGHMIPRPGVLGH